MTFVERAAQSVSKHFPGCVIALVGAVAADRLAGFVPVLSGLLLALAFGILLRVLGWVPWWAERGLRWCSRTPLYAGVALLGLHLVVDDLLFLGWQLLGAAVLVAYLALGAGLLAGRLLRTEASAPPLLVEGAAGGAYGHSRPGQKAPSGGRHDSGFVTVASVSIGLLLTVALLYAAEQGGGLLGGAASGEMSERCAIVAGLGLPHPALAAAALDLTAPISSGEAGSMAALALAAAYVMVRAIALLPVLWARGSARIGSRGNGSGGASGTAHDAPALSRTLVHSWYVAAFAAFALYRSVAGISPDTEATTTAIISMLLSIGLLAWGASLSRPASWRSAGRETLLALVVIVTSVSAGAAAVWMLS